MQIGRKCIKKAFKIYETKTKIMKKIFSLAVVALLLGGTAFAQHSAQKISFGLKAGLNVYNLNNSEDVGDFKTKLGFNAGALAHIHLASQLALQPEVYYSAQGAKYDVGSTEAKVKLGYINVPVMVQYMFDNGFRIQAGPQVGFLINAETEVGSTEVDIKDELKKVDFGITAGLSFVEPSTGLGIDARYNLGLSDINETDPGYKTTNRGFQVGLFYIF